jgi:hypothetical protein
MPPFYVRFQNQLERLLGDFGHVQPIPNIILTAGDRADLALTTGGLILNAQVGVDFGTLFTTFNTMTNNFTWNGGVGYSVGRVLETLDGTRTTGECKILAAALLGLWVFPAPFGLGQSGADLRASLYTFENYDEANGFISNHPQMGVRNLLPNILHPHGDPLDPRTYQPLYQWGDHKVVFYNGRLWDPSYKQIWGHESDMVAFEFTGQQHPRDATAYQIKVVTPNIAKGWLADQNMWMIFNHLNGGWRGPYRDIAM